MENFVKWIDETAGVAADAGRRIPTLERAAFLCLLLTAVSLPHSIAATQIAWLTGMAIWIFRLFIVPRTRFRPEIVDYLLWSFFIWSLISATFSYAPDISLDKLRVVGLFLLAYFAYHNIRTTRAAKVLATAPLHSCEVSSTVTNNQSYHVM